MGRHAAEESGIEFVDNATAPEFFANGLHDVEVMGPVCRFVLFVERRTAGGVLYREPSLHVIMPTEAIGPGITLTLKRTGIGRMLSAAGQAARGLMMQ